LSQKSHGSGENGNLCKITLGFRGLVHFHGRRRRGHDTANESNLSYLCARNKQCCFSRSGTSEPLFMLRVVAPLHVATGGCALSSTKAQELIRAWDCITPWLGITDGIDAMQGGCSPRRNRSTYGEQDCKLNRND
jgi:hypothetical protein